MICEDGHAQPPAATGFSTITSFTYTHTQLPPSLFSSAPSVFPFTRLLAEDHPWDLDTGTHWMHLYTHTTKRDPLEHTMSKTPRKSSPSARSTKTVSPKRARVVALHGSDEEGHDAGDIELVGLHETVHGVLLLLCVGPKGCRYEWMAWRRRIMSELWVGGTGTLARTFVRACTLGSWVCWTQRRQHSFQMDECYPGGRRHSENRCCTACHNKTACRARGAGVDTWYAERYSRRRMERVMTRRTSWLKNPWTQ